MTLLLCGKLKALKKNEMKHCPVLLRCLSLSRKSSIKMSLFVNLSQLLGNHWKYPLSGTKGWQFSLVWGKFDLRWESLTGRFFCDPVWIVIQQALFHQSSISGLQWHYPHWHISMLLCICGFRLLRKTFWELQKGHMCRKEKTQVTRTCTGNSKTEKNNMKYFICMRPPCLFPADEAKRPARFFPVPLTDENRECFWSEGSSIKSQKSTKERNSLHRRSSSSSF